MFEPCDEYYDDEFQNIDCYTDASYSKEVDGSVISYKIGNMPIQSAYLANVKNTQAEIYAVDKCIKIVTELHADENIHIHIHTDCQKVIELASNGKYPSFISTYKMKGHLKGALRNDKQRIFSKVDKQARKDLRRRLKIIRNNKQIINNQ